MIKQSDVQGRLRLLRYGLIVIVIMTFAMVLLAPYAFLVGADLTTVDGEPVEVSASITDFLTQALICYRFCHRALCGRLLCLCSVLEAHRWRRW